MSIRTIDRYRLDKQIGANGSSPVYTATETGEGGLERTVAVKLLPPLPENDKDRKERFFNEVRALNALSGKPYIVSVYRWGITTDDNRPWIAMEHLDRTLDDLIKPQPQSVDVVLRVMGQVLQGLSVMHGAKSPMLHNDLKPANILLDEAGNCKITDFGLASALEGQHTYGLATVHYTAPEALDPEKGKVGPHTDLYSVGHILYQLALGHEKYRAQFPQVFGGGASEGPQVVTRWMNWHCSENVAARPLHEIIPGFPVGVSNLVSKMMAKKITDRPRNAQAALAELGTAAQQSPSGSTSVPPPPQQPTEQPGPIAKLWRDSPALVIAAVVSLVLCVGLVAFMASAKSTLITLTGAQDSDGTFSARNRRVSFAGLVEHLPAGGKLKLTLPSGSEAVAGDIHMLSDGRFEGVCELAHVDSVIEGEVHAVRDGKTLASIPIKLVRRPPSQVHLIVMTEPRVQGATVTLQPEGGQAVRVTSDSSGAVEATLPYGPYTLKVESDDYQPVGPSPMHTGIEAEARKQVPLVLRHGYVNLEVDPKDAKVEFKATDEGLGAQQVAAQPGVVGKRYKLVAGTYTLNLSAEGYEAQSKEIVVTPGENRPLDLTLQKTQVAVAVPVQPVTPPPPADPDLAALMAMTEEQLLAFLKNEAAPLATLSFSKLDPKLSKINVRGPVLNEVEYQNLMNRMEKAMPRLDVREVRVDGDTVATMLQDDLRSRGLASARVRAYPRKNRGPAFLRVEFDATPGFDKASVQKLADRYVMTPDNVVVVAY
ncbi:MAG: protein kinase [Phycisphaera sp.]|nr:protein kinase [Phycisphaera sp.]